MQYTTEWGTWEFVIHILFSGFICSIYLLRMFLCVEQLYRCNRGQGEKKKGKISGPPHSSIQWVIPRYLLLVTGGRLCTCVPYVFCFFSTRSSECLFISLWPGEEWAVKDSEPLIPEITRGMRAGRPPVCCGLIKENICDGACIPLTAMSQTLKIPCFVNRL